MFVALLRFSKHCLKVFSEKHKRIRGVSSLALVQLLLVLTLLVFGCLNSDCCHVVVCLRRSRKGDGW